MLIVNFISIKYTNFVYTKSLQVCYKLIFHFLFMKIDPYKHEERYKNWEDEVLISGIKGMSKENSKIIIQYVTDMEHGLNVSIASPKGARGYPRLNTIREKMIS